MEKSQDELKHAKYGDSYYYGIWPTISSVTAEMDDMTVNYPTQKMYESMLNRVYDEVTKMYPEAVLQNGEKEDANLEQFRRPHRRNDLFRDLLGVLLLRELLNRRRHRY